MPSRYEQHTSALTEYYEQQIARNPPVGSEKWSDTAWLMFLYQEASHMIDGLTNDMIVDARLWCKARRLHYSFVASVAYDAGIPFFRHHRGKQKIGPGTNHFLKEHEPRLKRELQRRAAMAEQKAEFEG